MAGSDDAKSSSPDPDKIQEQNDSAVLRAKHLVARFKEVERFERTLDGDSDHNPKPNSKTSV